MNKTLIAAAILATSAVAHAENATYAIDPTHTFVTFEAAHFGTSTLRGRFDKKEGVITLDKAAKTGTVKVTIDMSSVSVGVPPMEGSLKGKGYFNVAEFANATFTADKFSFDGDKVSEVAGTLTMLGKTQPVTMKATRFNCYLNPVVSRETCGGDFETTIARSQFGMTNGMAFASDNIRLLIQVEAIKQ